MKIVCFAFATLLAASPLASALAQGTVSPSVGAGNSKEAADVKAGSGGTTDRSSATSTAAGSTGTVAGSNSTVADDKTATDRTKTGGTGGGGK